MLRAQLLMQASGEIRDVHKVPSQRGEFTIAKFRREVLDTQTNRSRCLHKLSCEV